MIELFAGNPEPEKFTKPPLRMLPGLTVRDVGVVAQAFGSIKMEQTRKKITTSALCPILKAPVDAQNCTFMETLTEISFFRTPELVMGAR